MNMAEKSFMTEKCNSNSFKHKHTIYHLDSEKNLFDIYAEKNEGYTGRESNACP